MRFPHCVFNTVPKKNPHEIIMRDSLFLVYEVELPADVTWIKANLNNTGFYRVNYPTHMWYGLIEQLVRENAIFSTSDRAQIINDAFSLNM